MSEQTCSSEGYLPIESGGDRMHQDWDQLTKQEQMETPQAFLGILPQSLENTLSYECSHYIFYLNTLQDALLLNGTFMVNLLFRQGLG